MTSVRLILVLAAAPLLVIQFLSPVAWADCTYGTPGCPYPPFGSSGADTQTSPSGPSPPPDVIIENNKQKGVLVPQQSTGPSPFGDQSPTNPEEAEAYRRAKEAQAKTTGGLIKKLPTGDVVRKADPTGGCGKGMHRGGGGQCYPDLH